MQQDMMTLFHAAERAQAGAAALSDQVNGAVITAPEPVPAYSPFIRQLDVSLDNAPYLIDHSLLRQPEGWPCVQDMDPVIPMTMIFELFGESAAAQAPRKKST